MCTIKNDLEATGAKCSGSGDAECKKCEYAVQTNADRIRNMTDEELAMFISSVPAELNCDGFCKAQKIDTDDEGTVLCYGACNKYMLEWLQAESEE